MRNETRKKKKLHGKHVQLMYLSRAASREIILLLVIFDNLFYGWLA